MVRVFGFEITRKRKNMHDLTFDERQMGLEVRQMNAAKRRLQHEIEMSELQLEKEELQAKLSEYEESDGEDDDINSLFQQILKPVLGGFVGSSNVEQASATIPPSTAHLDDEAIEDLITTIPKDKISLAKKMPDFVLKNYLQNNTPYDAETIERAIKIVKTKNL